MNIDSKRRRTEVIIVVSVVALLLLSVKLISMYVKKIEHEKYMMSRYNDMYTRVLYIYGEFEYERDKVIIKSMEVDKKSLLIDVALYNEYNEDKLTVDGLIEDYYEFCATGKEQDGMQKFFDFAPCLIIMFSFLFLDDHSLWRSCYRPKISVLVASV